VKDNITSSGGSIKPDFELVKGFTFVYLSWRHRFTLTRSCRAEVPDGMVGVLSNHDFIENVEEDANVSTQR
jgi:hypothetical protein